MSFYAFELHWRGICQTLNKISANVWRPHIKRHSRTRTSNQIENVFHFEFIRWHKITNAHVVRVGDNCHFGYNHLIFSAAHSYYHGSYRVNSQFKQTDHPTERKRNEWNDDGDFCLCKWIANIGEGKKKNTQTHTSTNIISDSDRMHKYLLNWKTWQLHHVDISINMLPIYLIFGARSSTRTLTFCTSSTFYEWFQSPSPSLSLFLTLFSYTYNCLCVCCFVNLCDVAHAYLYGA